MLRSIMLSSHYAIKMKIKPKPPYNIVIPAYAGMTVLLGMAVFV